MYSFGFLVLCAGALAGTVTKLEKPYYNIEDAEILFEQFIVNYEKEYEEVEEKPARLKAFTETLKRINQFNAEDELAVYDINRFSDLTPEEFSEMYFGLKRNSVNYTQTDELDDDYDDEDYTDDDDNFDWRDKNVVTRVKHQGQCGSCWAFSTTGAVESAYAIKHNKLVEVSEQQLVACERGDGNHGCNGGYMFPAMEYIKKVGGIESEASYPYEAVNGTCKFNAKNIVVKVSKAIHADVSSEDALKKQLRKRGPISISVAASQRFQNYLSGILTNCGNEEINHGVLLVGYGIENNTPYWIVKNSWGWWFGEKGYIRLQRGVNLCKMLNRDACFPEVE